MEKKINPIVSEFRSSRWEHVNRRTVNGRVPRWWCRQARFYLEKGIRLEMTKKEFFDWCESQSKLILRLYAEGKTPSIDRIDSSGNYEINNIQILDMQLNIAKRNQVSRDITDAQVEALPEKFCEHCKKKLIRKLTGRQRRESLAHFKKRLTCGRSCAMFVQMNRQKETR